MQTHFFRVFCQVTLCLVVGAGCSSKPEGPGDLDQKLNTQTNDSREQVGIRDEKVVIQKKVYLEEQLWALKSQVDELQRTLYGKSAQDPGGIWLGLKDCRKRIADPRIGGTGKPEPMEKWQNVTAQDEQFFYRADKNNNIVGVSEEALDERIQRYQKHQRLLSSEYDNLKDKLESCEENYQSALVQHGLNPDDTKAKGEWVDGPQGYKIWKMKVGATKDPEELMRRKEQKVRAPISNVSE